MMVLYPNAKINLGLLVGATRSDGYHNIETIFYPIDLHDELCIERSDDGLRFLSDGIAIDCCAEDNLIMRTYRMMRNRFDLGDVSITLHKHIPFGAGLGGGSSDAAFTAMALNELFDLRMSRDELASIVSPIGADCPFFIYNQPMLAEGIGNVFSLIHLDLSHYWLALVKPDINISTAQAYHHVPQQQLSGRLADLILQPVGTWKDMIGNSFEHSVFPHHPLLNDIKERFYAAGAVYASMTGTGAAVYGIFAQRPVLPASFDRFFTHTAKFL